MQWPKEVLILEPHHTTDGPFCLRDGSPGCLAGWMQAEFRLVPSLIESLQMCCDWYSWFNIVHHYMTQHHSKASMADRRRVSYNVTWCLLGYEENQSPLTLSIADKVRHHTTHVLKLPHPEPTLVCPITPTNVIPHPDTGPSPREVLDTSPIQVDPSRKIPKLKGPNVKPNYRSSSNDANQRAQVVAQKPQVHRIVHVKPSPATRGTTPTHHSNAIAPAVRRTPPISDKPITSSSSTRPVVKPVVTSILKGR